MTGENIILLYNLEKSRTNNPADLTSYEDVASKDKQLSSLGFLYMRSYPIQEGRAMPAVTSRDRESI